MSVRVCVAEARAVRVTAGTPAAAVSVTGPVVAAHGEEYTGPTTVTPSGSAQTLPTAHKYLTDNIIVREIQRWDVGNPSGGTTVFIGEE